MTKDERKYLQMIIKENKEIIKQVESGKLWADIYTTDELRLAYIQGLGRANDIFDKFVNG